MALRRATLVSSEAEPLPSVLAVRRLAMKLRFKLKSTEEHRWLFGLFSESKEDVLADLRFHFEVGSALSTAPSGTGEVRSEFAPPPFLESPVSGESTVLRCRSGRRLRLEGRGKTLRIFDETLERELVRHVPWPCATVVDLLETIRDWLSSGEEGEPIAFAVPATSKTGSLFRAIATGQARLAQDVREIQRRRGAALFELRSSHRALLTDAIRLHREHPDFVPRYEVQRSEMRTLVRWDENGRLLKPDSREAWLRAEVRARCLVDEEPLRCLLTLTLPDALTVGRPFFDEFLESLIARGRRQALVEVLKTSWNRKGGVARRFLDSVDEERCILIRVDPKDHDLVILEGLREGVRTRVLLEVKFDVKQGYPDVEVTPEELKHLDTWSGSPSNEPVSDEMHPAYFFRLFRVLVRWLGANRQGEG
jgi:hypothetical protein